MADEVATEHVEEAPNRTERDQPPPEPESKRKWFKNKLNTAKSKIPLFNNGPVTIHVPAAAEDPEVTVAILVLERVIPEPSAFKYNFALCFVLRTKETTHICGAKTVLTYIDRPIGTPLETDEPGENQTGLRGLKSMRRVKLDSRH